MTINPVDALLKDLYDAMTAAGLSQADIARRMGVTEPYISMVFTGRKNPTLAWLRRMWDVIVGVEREETP